MQEQEEHSQRMPISGGAAPTLPPSQKRRLLSVEGKLGVQRVPRMRSYRKSCDCCVKRKVKCDMTHTSFRGGCTSCVRNSRICRFSLKQRPGPKADPTNTSGKQSLAGTGSENHVPSPGKSAKRSLMTETSQTKPGTVASQGSATPLESGACQQAGVNHTQDNPSKRQRSGEAGGRSILTVQPWYEIVDPVVLAQRFPAVYSSTGVRPAVNRLSDPVNVSTATVASLLEEPPRLEPPAGSAEELFVAPSEDGWPPASVGFVEEVSNGDTFACQLGT